MCLAQGPQHSDTSEARTGGPSVSSQALYHCAPTFDQISWIYFEYSRTSMARTGLRPIIAKSSLIDLISVKKNLT